LVALTGWLLEKRFGALPLRSARPGSAWLMPTRAWQHAKSRQLLRFPFAASRLVKFYASFLISGMQSALPPTLHVNFACRLSHDELIMEFELCIAPYLIPKASFSIKLGICFYMRSKRCLLSRGIDWLRRVRPKLIQGTDAATGQ